MNNVVVKGRKRKKYLGLILIAVLVVLIVVINHIGHLDVYKGLVNIKNAYVDNLKASVSEISGYDEVEYEVKFTLDDELVSSKYVEVHASITEDENKYAYFSDIEEEGITTKLSDDRSSIIVYIEEAKTGVENTITLKLIVQGAPNGFKITPAVTVVESEDNTKTINVDTVEVKTNSVTGLVLDENNLPVSNIELKITKDEKEIKRTYTDEDGRYVFTDLEVGNYSIEIVEEKYEQTDIKEVTVEEGIVYNINVKKSDGYKINVTKKIRKVDLIVNGKEYTYTYEDLDKVVQTVKNAKTISGTITYVVTAQNTGSKAGIVSAIKDVIPDGLSFDQSINSNWEERNGSLYNIALEGITLEKGEEKTSTLILNIDETNEAKTYLNEITAIGEEYEKVVYILDGEIYKEEEVLEGEKVTEVSINNEKFTGWYTDKNYTNKYNFDLELTKDLILYGTVKDVSEYTIKYIDQNEVVKEEVVIEGGILTPPNDPEKEGYTFTCWSKGNTGECYNTLTPAEEDLELYSVYEVNNYTVEFYDNDEKIEALEVEYNETINTSDVPSVSKEGYTFVGWYEKDSKESFSFDTKITEDKKLYSKYEIITNSVIFNDDGRVTTVDVDYGETVEEVENQGKEGYTFKYWSTEENGTDPFDFETEIHETTTLYAVYEINTYTVTFNDEERITQVSVDYGNTVSEIDNQGKEGYTFKYFSLSKDGYAFDYEIKITEDITLYAIYEINTYTVTYIDQNMQYATETVNYNETTTKPEIDPTKEYNIFAGWTLNNELYDFNSPVTSDIELISSYEEVEAPEITHTPTEWTNSNVTVTIGNTNHSDYTYKYQIDDGEYVDYTGEFEVSENCTVTAISIKDGVQSKKTEHVIDNIDKIKPVLSDFSATNIAVTGFTINVSAIDYESGLKSIDIYKNGVPEISVYYNEDVNDLKTYSYDFTNLSEGTTYSIKIVATDIAGNVSESIEEDVTTREEIIVARIIGRNDSLYETEEEYENFTSLAGAIESCGENQCTVQMVLSTNESVEVLEGQDITLDLNGKTITGVKNYTIDNYGELIIVEWSSEIGSIVNNTGTVIKNSGILQLGENEDELVVSTESPNIIGTAYGIYTDDSATFKFYDGRIEGAIAVQGEVDDTPYLYNAVVNSSSVQTATLSIVADAEARIESVYYSNVMDAVNDTENGTTIENESESTLLTGFVASNSYGFTYDDETETLQSDNSLTASIAEAYTVIDLRNYTTNQQLSITGYVTSTDGTSTVSVSESDIDLSIIEGTTETSSFDSTELQTSQFILKAGNLYYVKLYNYNSSSISSETDRKFIISSITLSEFKLEALNIDNTTGIVTATVNYGFDYDEETNTFKSNNQYTSSSMAFSYFEIDLTSVDVDQELIINASLDTLYTGNYGNIIVSEDNKMYYSATYNALAYMFIKGTSYSTNIGPHNYTQTLTAGKKYYVQFYYFKGYDTNSEETYVNSGSADQFIINSIDVVPATKTSTIDLSTELITPDEYGFASSGSYYAPTNYGVTNSTAHSYIKIDLTDETTDKSIKVKLSASISNFYVVVTDSPDLPSYIGSFVYAANSQIYSNYYYGNLTSGEVNYVHFVYKRESTSPSVNIYDAILVDAYSYDLSTDLVTVSDYGFTDYYSSNNSYYLSSVTTTSTVDSYVKIDLTNAETDQYVTINASLNYLNSYIYLTDNKKFVPYSTISSDKTKALLYFDYKNESYYYINGSQYYYSLNDYKFVLTKGNVYYLHIANYNNQSYTTNSSYINSILLSPATSNELNVGDYIVSTGTEEGTASEKDYVIDETEDENFRYIGSNPDNYVYFNDEVWRIVGIFETEDENGNVDERIKLVRNDSIGTYSWDSSSGSTSNENNGYGINEWTQADLMKLLNPGYEDEEVGGSLYYNSSSGTCYAGTNNATTSCDFSSTGLSDSAKEMIDTVVWNTGAVSYNLSSSTIYDVYSQERSTNTGKTGYENTDGFPADDAERTYTWTGKVGLVYASDVVMAAGDYGTNASRSECMNTAPSSGSTCVAYNDWLNVTSPSFTISPSYGNYPFFALMTVTSVNAYPAAQSAIVRPSVYLSTNVQIKSGTGTSSDPYIFELGEEKNTTIYYGLDSSLLEEDEEENIITYESKTNDYEKLRKYGDVYGFTYDQYSDEFRNDNKGIDYSLSVSYVEIDLTTETESKELVIDYSLLTTSSTSYAYITLMEDELSVINYDDYQDVGETLVSGLNVETKNAIIKKSLEPGHIYYIQFAYNKQNNDKVSDTNLDEFNVKLDYQLESENTEEYLKYDGTTLLLNEDISTIEILKNIVLTDSIEISNAKNVVLDLRGYTITTTSSDYVITNNGILTIIDSVYPDLSDNTGIITSTTYSTILNNKNATLTIENATIDLEKTGEYYGIENYGNLSLLNDTQILATLSKNVAIYNGSSGNASIDSNLISGYQYAIYNESSRNFNTNINSLNSKSSSGYGIYNNGIGNMNLNITTFNAAGKYGVYNDGTGIINLNVNELNFTGTYGIYNNNIGDMYISVDLFETTSSSSYAIYNYNKGNMNINVDTFSLAQYGIHNLSSGDIYLVSSLITSSGTAVGGATILNSGDGNFIVDVEELTTSLDAIRNTSSGLITAKFNSLKSNRNAAYNSGSGNIDLEATTLTASYAMYNISTGTINAIIDNLITSSCGIYNSGSGQVIAVVDDITSSGEYVVKNTGAGKIDLTATTIDMSSSTKTTTYGVYNSSSSYADNVIVRNSTFVFPSSNTYYGVYNKSKGNVYLYDCNMSIPTSSGYAIYSTSKTYVYDSTINSEETPDYAIYLEKDSIFGSIYLDNTDISGFKYGIYNSSSGTITSQNSSITSSYGIYNSTGATNVNDSDVISSSGSGISGNGSISVEDSTITGYSSGISGGSSSTITVKNSIITATEDSGGIGIVAGINSSGKLDITESNIISSSYGLYCSNTTTMTGGSITSTGVGAYFNGSFSVDISDVEIISGTRGIYSKGSNINILNGSVTGTEYGIYADSGSIVTLGLKDQIVNNSSPKITSEGYGIYGQGELNFYDGIITGEQDNGLYITVLDSEENYDLYIETNSDDSTLEDITLEIPSIEKFGDVASVDGITYPSVKAAFDSIDSNEKKVITVLKSKLTILNLGSSDKNIEIDLNGNNIKYYGDDTYITNLNSFKILDDNQYENEDVAIISMSSTIVENMSSFSLDEETKSNVILKQLIGDNTLIINDSSCNADIKGSISGNNAIDNSSDGDVNIEGVNVDGTITNNSGSIEILNGTITTSKSTAITNNAGTIEISGSNVSSAITAISNISGITTVNNSNISTSSSGTSVIAISNSSGTISFTDCTITSDGYKALDNSEGIINMYNSVVTGSSSQKYLATAVRNGSSGEINIYESTITGANYSVQNSSDGVISIYDSEIEGVPYGIYNSSTGIINIYSGTITNTSTSSSSSAIYNTSTGTINLGTKGDTDENGNLVVSKESPLITSSGVGVYNSSSGTLNFYDGIIKAATAIDGSVNEVEDGYEIILDGDDDYAEIKYLDLLPVAKIVSTGEEYYSIQDAVDAASDGDTVQIIREVTILSTASAVEVLDTKNISLDLNGYVIHTGNSVFINNKGILKIVDSNNIEDEDGNIEFGDGEFELTGGTLVENTGTLQIDAVTIYGNENSSNVISNIESGILEINDSNISTSDYYLANIYNDSAGTVTLNDTSISNGISLINNSTETVNITGGSLINYNSKYEDLNSIMNNSSGTINISGATIKSNYSISNLSLGKINTYDATISGIVLNDSTGEIIINDGSVSSSVIALYNNSLGSITSNNSKINGSDYSVYNISDGTVNINDCTITSGTKSDGSIYNSNGTINLLGGTITYTSSTSAAIYNTDGTVNIDGTEITSTSSEYGAIYNDGTNGIIEFANGTITGSYYGIYNNSSLTSGSIIVDSGYVSSSKSITDSSGYSIYNNSTGGIEINGGTITATRKSQSAIAGSAYGIYNVSSGNIIVNGGSIIESTTYVITSYYGIWNVSKGNVTINDGEINLIYNNGNGVINTYGGEEAKIYNASSGTINIQGGTITSINNTSSGTIKISGGEINTTGTRDIYNAKGKMYISGGVIANTNTSTSAYAIYNLAGTVYITGGQISSQNAYIYNSAGTINLSNITLEGAVKGIEQDDGVSNVTSNVTIDVSGTGIYLADGTLNIGISDGDLNENSPSIAGTNYGVYNSSSGTLNFYDGIIKGATAINGSVNEVEDGYQLILSSDEEYGEKCYLDLPSLVMIIRTKDEYNNLQEAVDAAEEGDTIQVVRDFLVSSKTGAIEISEGKEIIFDLNGYTITTKNSGFVNNSGSLEFIDSSVGEYELGNGSIIGTAYTIKNMNNGIVNIGNVNIGRVIDSSSDGTINIYNGSMGTVSNQSISGTINIQGGDMGAVSNESTSGIINISGGNIETYGTGITISSGTINISNIDSISVGAIGISQTGGILNIFSNFNLNASDIGIKLLSGTLNLGIQDAIVGTTSPSITGTNYGIYNEDGEIYFYDGIINSSSIALYGTIAEVEPGYKLNMISGDVNSIYLVLIGETERIASFNGLNFIDLQTAFDSVPDNVETTVTLYADYTLPGDITVSENKIIILDLNGYTITYGDYEFTGDGKLTIKDGESSTSVLASIASIVADALNIDTISKNIIIYEMEDGSNLSANKTYKLYKLDGDEYALVYLQKEDEIGNYTKGNDITDMRTVKNRLYINNLGSGSYKIVDNDGKEISFTISDDGQLSNNIKENLSSSTAKRIATATAELIIMIQTGSSITKYIVLLLIMLIIIVSLILLFKNKKNNLVN